MSPFSTKRKFIGIFRFVVHERSENPYEKMLCLFLAQGDMCPPHMVFKLCRLSPRYRSTQQQILTKQLTPWSRVILEKFPHILWNLKVHYSFHNILPRVPILIRMNLVQTFQFFFRPSYIVYHHLCLGFQRGIFLHISRTKYCMRVPSPPYVPHAPSISHSSI